MANFVEIGLSFLEGLALIASPCILPVLPLVLGASVEGGRRRPFGIILGFVLAFTAFAMLSRQLVAALGIDLDIIKNGSLIFLGLFGLVLLSERLSALFSQVTQRFASAGSNLTANAGDGFGSGILIGMMIGLIWTPCAGPIIAAVLVQIIRQESDIEALLLVGSFALGAGVPMLVIALTGKKIMSKLGFFATHAEAVRKGFGVLILLAVAFIASGIDPQSLFSAPETPVVTSSNSQGLQNALPAPYAASEITGIQEWLNSAPLTLASLKGKVVLIDFWTYSCINCVRTLPHVTRWDRAYRDKGLVIIGVHAPEFEFEKDVGNVRKALAKHGIEYPVAIDNRLDTWTAFQNRYWPAHYLIDQEGRVVYTHFGEGSYAQTEHNIRTLLGLDAQAATTSDVAQISSVLTHETYLGMLRAERFASLEKPVFEVPVTFTQPEALPLHHWALSGEWQADSQRIIASKAGATITIHFTAKKVFLVLGSKDGKSIEASLKLNGQPLGIHAGKDTSNSRVMVTQNTLYELVNQEDVRAGILEITATQAGLEAYAFTFGD